jgi:hypothetical protein
MTARDRRPLTHFNSSDGMQIVALSDAPLHVRKNEHFSEPKSDAVRKTCCKIPIRFEIK